MKSFNVGLLNDVVGSYDKTKTTRQGRVALKTLPAPHNSTQVLGPPLTKFIDVFTDTVPVASVLPGQMHLTDNDRLFVLQSTLTIGVANTLLLYNFNRVTGVHSYVGRIAFAMPGTGTITVRGIKVDDTNPANIRVFIAYVITTATTGGVVMINGLSTSDFVPAGFPTIYTAQTSGAKAVYHLQAPLETGGAHTLTTAAGLSLPAQGSLTPAINTKVYVHNGTSATHQMFIFDYAASPTIASIGVGTVTAGNTTGANTTFTMTGNNLKVNDTVIITSNAPTGYTASAVNVAQTIYYVVATNFVAGSTFSLSATLGGAIVSASTVSTTTTFVRALGACDNLFVAKTANLTALGAGTLLLTNSENYCVPSSGANSGQECVFMATTTNFYLGKYTDLYSTQTGTTSSGSPSITGLSSTAGLTIGQTVFGVGIPAAAIISSITGPTSITISANATASGSNPLNFGAILWPSLISCNVLGTSTDYVTPTPISAAYATSIDRVVYPVSTSTITIVKQFVNSAIESFFGSAQNVYMEAQNRLTDQLSLLALNSFENSSGWMLYSSSATVGQRGIMAFDLRSDWRYEYSSIISPVLPTPGSQTLAAIKSVEQLFDCTASLVFQYRTASTLSDPIFNTASGSWTTISTGETLNIALNNFTQFRLLFGMTSSPAEGACPVTTPAQVSDIVYTTALLAEISDYWDYSYNDSSSAIPTRVGFSMRTAYATGTVPKLYFRAYDTAGVLILTADTVANASNFQYSTDSGASWNPLGTIPNTPNTRIRYTFTTPPGVDIRVSLKEV